MFDLFRSDLDRLRRYGSRESTVRLLLTNQGLWAIACYRAGNHLMRHRLPRGLHQLVMVPYHIWWKLVEMTTGISISPDCTIGPGLYIGHFGGIIVHPDVRIGRDCNLSQSVTLGLGASEGRWGVPVLGDRVYVAPGAKVIGPVHLRDGTVVGANAVVTHSTEENDVVGGIPARVLSRKGSAEYIPAASARAGDETGIR
jgi:serine O-acetyltransferase